MDQSECKMQLRCILPVIESCLAGVCKSRTIRGKIYLLLRQETCERALMSLRNTDNIHGNENAQQTTDVALS